MRRKTIMGCLPKYRQRLTYRYLLQALRGYCCLGRVLNCALNSFKG